jgi:hypothetical protein
VVAMCPMAHSLNANLALSREENTMHHGHARKAFRKPRHFSSILKAPLVKCPSELRTPLRTPLGFRAPLSAPLGAPQNALQIQSAPQMPLSAPRRTPREYSKIRY